MITCLGTFELASGVRGNFAKSRLLGVNVSDDFLDMGARFLYCKRGTLPFRYFGLPVGANPCRVSYWDHMLQVIRRSLLSWHYMSLSFGGRLVLLNLVLRNNPIFYLSFMKLPIMVWKEVVDLRKDFLWGAGTLVVKKIPWVRWSDICKPKSGGGLGVRDLRVVNISLLGKWRWRHLTSGNSFWRQFLVSKYG